MKKTIKAILMIFFILTLLTGAAAVPGYAAEAAVENTAAEETGVPGDDIITEEKDTSEEVIRIMVPHINAVTHAVLNWEFPYTDDYFRQPSDEFSRELAKASLGLMVSAFRNNGQDLEDQYETYLSGAGFSKIHPFGYDQDTSKDTLSGVIGSRKIDDFTLIAAAACGQGYKKEWAGNLEVGDEERHVGFNNAARVMEEQIESYIQENGITGKIKLWITGFSRAAAVSNITAADMIDSGIFEDVYAYLYGVPRTTRTPDPHSYTGIFNICGKYDPVTQIPTQYWGYERYGQDLYTPAQEMDSRYLILNMNALDAAEELIGKGLRYNPEVNYQIHLLLEFLSEMFPTSKEYAESLQDSIMELWTEPNAETMGLILIQAVSQMEDLDSRQEYSSAIFIDYMTYIMSQHLKEEQNQIKNGYWDLDQKIAENVLREHMPYTYIIWAFSDNTDEDVFAGPDMTRRIAFFGNVDIEVWKGDFFMNGMNRKGEYIYPEQDLVFDESMDFDELLNQLLQGVFITRNGRETIVSIPADGAYSIRIHSDRVDNLLYYDVIGTPYKTYGSSDTMFIQTVTAGDYELQAEGITDLTGLTVLEGSIYNDSELEFEYSPTMVMSTESGAEDHITLEGLFQLLFYSLLAVLGLLFICLIIFIVHFIRRRRGHKPFSSWYVIAPHLLAAAGFLLLTQFFTYNMFTIGKTREVCAALTMLVLFLLALRGLIRRRNVPNLIITLFILGLGIVNCFWYQKSLLVSSSALNFVIYGVCIAGLAALACSTFFRKKKEKAAL